MNEIKLKQIFHEIKTHETIILCAHYRPDGDAVGSTFGLKDIILATWPTKNVYVVGDTTEFTKFIGTPEVIDNNVFEGALFIALDTANKDRLADQRYTKAKTIIKIDHHIKVEDFGDVDYVDTNRPACTLIILDLYQLFMKQLTMTEEGAKALYFGTLTDTGRFRYEGVNGDTFRSVALLFDIGFNKTEIHRYLDRRSEELTRFKGYLLQHNKKTKNGVVYFKIKPRHLRKFKVTLEEATSLVNELGVFEDYPIWLLFAAYEEGEVRCRLRSKGPAINELAAKYDGGGHKFASGATLGTWKRTKDLIKDADQLAKEYNKVQTI